MKLQTLKLTCGGKLGCGTVFEFSPDSTTTLAARTLREHRAEPGHAGSVLAETNRNRVLDGQAPITMEELLGLPVKDSTDKGGIPRFVQMMEESNTASLEVFRAEIIKLRNQARPTEPKK